MARSSIRIPRTWQETYAMAHNVGRMSEAELDQLAYPRDHLTEPWWLASYLARVARLEINRRNRLEIGA